MREDEEKFGEYHELKMRLHSIELIMIFEGGVGNACIYCKNRRKKTSILKKHSMLKDSISDSAILHLLKNAKCLFLIISDHERKRSLNLNVMEKAVSETAISSPSVTSSESFLARLGLVCSSKDFGA